ncbi:lipid-A-disaccharide synthase [Bartonella australis AUST/NH1]|uniref:Lipid-A-disaccharide synthase n=1 Tax=Bartonella australis (strain Aust/NH1) TaxID=1094489 RepID=M1NY82_BARAA|nr:lipid-A-disaccharide synthase [Bartonella australis]AGF74432.1 lipid-A-disaccharide synthase [Bartonella australis AUST/NH1]
MNDCLKIAIVAGEESGDLLGADLISSLSHQMERDIHLIGVGGKNLESLGLKSVFNFDDINLIGLGAVLKKLPLLLTRIRTLSKFIAREKPDCLIIIDSPDFTHRIAKKVRVLAPSIPIIKYVAPTVWAWRPERAKAMCGFIDHVLAVFPFEEKIMKDLGGPPTTYVGHRLLTHPPLLAIQAEKKHSLSKQMPLFTMVVLPGSRTFEVRHLMPIFGKAVEIVRQRIPNLRILLPTLPHLVNEVRFLAQNWSSKAEIVVGEDAKWRAFGDADVALAALGTVSLELALAKIPMVLCYKLDYLSKLFFLPKITSWSAALPNIIVDKPIIPEYFNEFSRPGILARQVEQLLRNRLFRQAQFDAFDIVEQRMRTKTRSGVIAAQVVINFLKKKSTENCGQNNIDN